MILATAWRMARTTDARLLWKFSYNFAYKGMRSVQRFKARLQKGHVFPPFIYISVTSTCNLRCRGCWVDVDAPARSISLEDLDTLITKAKAHGNRFFGLLGGEPFLYPHLFDILKRHGECYFQIFSNGHFITDEVAAKLRKIGNATPLISIEGQELASAERRGRSDVFEKSLEGLKTCTRHRLITGVTTSVCQNNYADMVNEEWVNRLLELGVHYVWYTTYRPVGPDPAPELALTPEQILGVRRFAMHVRNTKPIGVVDAYWDDEGYAICPAAVGISHHIGPGGDIEPCPIIQFGAETIRDNGGDVYETIISSPFLRDFRRVTTTTTRGCIVLERPDLLQSIVEAVGAKDTTSRGTAIKELEAMQPRTSQHCPGQEIPEENWVYRFAKRHWFFGFGAYA